MKFEEWIEEIKQGLRGLALEDLIENLDLRPLYEKGHSTEGVIHGFTLLEVISMSENKGDKEK